MWFMFKLQPKTCRELFLAWPKSEVTAAAFECAHVQCQRRELGGALWPFHYPKLLLLAGSDPKHQPPRVRAAMRTDQTQGPSAGACSALARDYRTRAPVPGGLGWWEWGRGHRGLGGLEGLAVHSRGGLCTLIYTQCNIFNQAGRAGAAA